MSKLDQWKHGDRRKVTLAYAIPVRRKAEENGRTKLRHEEKGGTAKECRQTSQRCVNRHRPCSQCEEN